MTLPIGPILVALVVGAVAGGTLTVGVLGAPPHPGGSLIVSASCDSASTTSIHGGSYLSCTVPLAWNLSLGFAVQQLASVAFGGVAFTVTGWNTADCPVVNVTGHETAGTSPWFLISPQPDNCTFVQPTVFASDGAFGATWTGGSVIQLYALAPSAP